MPRNYLDKRRNDRLSMRSLTLRDEKLVKDLDTYCYLNDIKITDYVVNAIKKQLDFDMDNLQTLIKQEKEIKYEQSSINWKIN